MASQPLLYCHRSRIEMPVRDTRVRGWLYLCDYACSEANVVYSALSNTYCSTLAEIYDILSAVIHYAVQHRSVIDIGTSYFFASLPRFTSGWGLKCLTEGKRCRRGTWLLRYEFRRDGIYIFSDKPKYLEELLRIERPYMPTSFNLASIFSSMLSSTFKDSAEAIVGALASSISPLSMSRMSNMIRFASEAMAQILTSCASKSPSWINRYLRYAACGSFVPIDAVYRWLRELEDCIAVGVSGNIRSCVSGIVDEMRDELNEITR